jgi:polyphosphate kinase
VRVADAGEQAMLSDLFGLAMDEGTAAWRLHQDGSWARRHLDSSGRPLRDLQDYLIQIRRGSRADAGSRAAGAE